MIGQDTETKQDQATPAQTPQSNPPQVPKLDFGKFGLAMVPVTPVSFSGKDSFYAWSRLGIYGTAAALTWSKSRRLSYIMIGAVGLSLVTSLAGNAWNGESK